MTTPEAARNRRRSRWHKPKRGTKAECRKGAYGLGPDLAGSVLDVSESGIRLLVKTPLKPGDEVELAIEGPGQSRPSKITARVVWCVATADGAHCVGAQFQRDLRYADLHLLARL